MLFRGTAIALSAVMLLAVASSAHAQDAQPTGRLCFHARPGPQCRLFAVTDAGIAFGTSIERGVLSDRNGVERTTLDWGAMWNVGERNAVGASWFLSVGEEATSTGPTLRYRRWLTTTQSVDVAAGTPVGSTHFEAGSVLGLVKYNPAPWVGIVVRPEAVLHSDFVCSLPSDFRSCSFQHTRSSRVLVGAELAETPGAITGAAVGIVWGLLVLALNSSW